MLKAGHRGTRCAAAPGRQRQHQHPARDEEETEGLAPDLDLRGIHPGLLEKLEESQPSALLTQQLIQIYDFLDYLICH